MKSLMLLLAVTTPFVGCSPHKESSNVAESNADNSNVNTSDRKHSEIPGQKAAANGEPITPSDISQDQLTRLFSMTWDANDSATMAYSGNRHSDPQSLKDYSWLQCIQLKSSVFFKDAGLKWKTTRDDFLIDLPVKSKPFNEKIRIIDNYHFAFNDGKHWLVFRARDWEDDHYTPPK